MRGIHRARREELARWLAASSSSRDDPSDEAEGAAEAAADGRGSVAAPWELPNFSCVLSKQLRIEGFQARAHFDLFGEYVERMSAWLDSGQVRFVETISHGLESCPRALMSMLDGENVGKQLVQVSEDPLASTPHA